MGQTAQKNSRYNEDFFANGKNAYSAHNAENVGKQAIRSRADIVPVYLTHIVETAADIGQLQFCCQSPVITGPAQLLYFVLRWLGCRLLPSMCSLAPITSELVTHDQRVRTSDNRWYLSPDTAANTESGACN